MASITLNSSFNDTVDNSTNSGVFSTQVSSSNWLGGNETIGSVAWTNLPFNSGSLNAPLAFVVSNTINTYSSSIVAVATGSTGQGVITHLFPGQSINVAWSGSSYNNNQGVFVSVVGGWPFGIATPPSASVQWKVQQM